MIAPRRGDGPTVPETGTGSVETSRIDATRGNASKQVGSEGWR